MQDVHMSIDDQLPAAIPDILPRIGDTLELADSQKAPESSVADSVALDLEARLRSGSVNKRENIPSESFDAEVKSSSGRREKVKLAACYWSLAAIGEYGGLLPDLS